MTITNVELTQMKERAETATHGPWIEDSGILRAGFEGDEILDYSCGVNGVYDIKFIAHAREDVPRLVAEVERLRELLREIIQNSESPRTVSDLSEEALNGE